jgi:hypothetical protein
MAPNSINLICLGYINTYRFWIFINSDRTQILSTEYVFDIYQH